MPALLFKLSNSSELLFRLPRFVAVSRFSLENPAANALTAASCISSFPLSGPVFVPIELYKLYDLELWERLCFLFIFSVRIPDVSSTTAVIDDIKQDKERICRSLPAPNIDIEFPIRISTAWIICENCMHEEEKRFGAQTTAMFFTVILFFSEYVDNCKYSNDNGFIDTACLADLIQEGD